MIEKLESQVEVIKENIQILSSSNDVLDDDTGELLLESNSHIKDVYLSQEYINLDTINKKISEYITIMNERYYSKVGTLHYLVKLGYSDKELLELSPIELLVKQYKIHEIEEEIAKKQEEALKSVRSNYQGR